MKLQQFIIFALNYNSDFIEECWGVNTAIGIHMREKFNSYIDKFGGYGTMVKFAANLSNDHLEKLELYILTRDAIKRGVDLQRFSFIREKDLVIEIFDNRDTEYKYIPKDQFTTIEKYNIDHSK